MAQESYKRKLTAILSADVEGYSRLMADDEEATVQTITSYREEMINLIRAHNGRVADAKGDNILAEFASVVDSVRCAVEIQRQLKKRNSDLPNHRKMEFRMGVNLGDVIEEEETIYGDGVNVAARLESHARPGGICISGTAYDQVKNKIDLGYEYIGEQTVKNIPEPVRVYRVLIEPEYAGKIIGEERPKPRRFQWKVIATAVVIVLVAGALALWNFHFRQPPIETASIEKMNYPLPDKPSIAVLPFDNLSGDPEQDYIADGITENIIAGLSQIPDMFVIARNSVFTYKGKPVKIQQVSEELGVQYVVAGSVQISGDRLRLTAQLIDAVEGHHLWAERYDRELEDLFDLQDELTLRILDAIQVKLMVGESPTLHGTDNFEAWGHFIRGYGLLNRGTEEDISRARKHFEQAIKIDPDYAQAWANLGASHRLEVVIGVSKSPAESIKRALELVQKASALGGVQAYIHDEMIWIYMLQGQYDKAIAEGERAVALEPNSARSHIFLAMVLRYAKRPEQAIAHAQTAMRLEPYYQAWFLPPLAGAYEMVGRYDEAIATWKELLDRALRGEFPPIYVHERLALNYARLDQMENAWAHAEEILKIKPDYSVEFFRKTTPYKDQKYLDSLVALLIKAGLPEHPPLPLPDKPSIAVLAFDNMSGDPKQEYIVDGITENIITSLSKVHDLFVISRNSSFTYKGKPVKAQQVSKELGVRYVLEGSVQISGNQVRVIAQLVDAIDGKHLWSERYDRDFKDIFELQDELASKVVNSLIVKLVYGEEAKLWQKNRPNNLEFNEKYFAADFYLSQFNKEANIKAKQLYKEAIKLEPKYFGSYAGLAYALFMDVHLGLSTSPRESLGEAIKLCEKAIALDESQDMPHRILGHIYAISRNFDKAIEEGELAIALNPNSAFAYETLGRTLLYVGRPEEALDLIKKGDRLNPLTRCKMSLGSAYREAGKYEEAIIEFKRCIKSNPNNLIAHLALTGTYALAVRYEEARKTWAEVLKLDPKITAEKALPKWWPYGPDHRERQIAALHKAGIK